MGRHQPEHQPADHTDGSAPAAVGPRVAAARSRRKRTLIVASAAGLTLAVGGTAAAAVMATGGDPQSGTSAVGVPEADPDPLVPDDAIPDQDGEAADRAQEAAAAAVENSSADGDGIAEEEEEQEEPDESTGSDGEGDGESSGDGGACEASFYGEDFAGSTTANGETFDPQDMTAAHKTLPFDTMVEVTDPGSGDSVTVRINDRGPYIDGRCLDLSTAAFDEIIGTGAGVGTVDWEVVG